MKASQFLTKFHNCNSEEELLAIFFSPDNYEQHQLNPLTLLLCLRDICTNQQVYFERFLEPKSTNESIHGLIAECYPRAEDGKVQWDKTLYVMLDDLEVGECECNQKIVHRLVYGDDDNKENHS